MKNTFRKIGFALTFITMLAFIFAIGSIASASETAEVVYGESADALTRSGTLAEALGAAKTDSSIKYVRLQKDISGGFYISGGKFTLDLNGKTITSDGYTLVIRFAGTEITVTDTSTGGSIISNNSGCSALLVEDGASAVVLGGVYEGIGGAAWINEGCSAVIKDGYFKAGQMTTVDVVGTAVIEGGTFESGGWFSLLSSGNVTVKGGSFEKGVFGQIGYAGGLLDLSAYQDIGGLSVCQWGDPVVIGESTVKLPEGYGFVDETPAFVEEFSRDSAVYTVQKKELKDIMFAEGGRVNFSVSRDTVVDEAVILENIVGVVAKYSYGDGYIYQDVTDDILIEIQSEDKTANLHYENRVIYVFWDVKTEIKTLDALFGRVEVDNNFGLSGDVITVNVIPEPGYELDTLTVTDKDGTPLELDGYSFILGDNDVTVSATFKEKIEARWGSSKDDLTHEGSLAAAIAAANAKEASYIQLLCNIEGELHYNIDDAAVTLDLFGKTINNTYTNTFVIRGSSNVVIVDSVGGGVIRDEEYGAVIRVVDDATLTIESGKFEGMGTVIVTDYYGHVSNSTVIIKGGEYVSLNSNNFSVWGREFSILGGTFTALQNTVYLVNGKLKVLTGPVTFYVDSRLTISEDTLTFGEDLLLFLENAGEVDEIINGEFFIISKKITVSFDANGGTGTMEDEATIAGEYELPTSTDFTAPEGLVFVGWSETPDGDTIGTEFIKLDSSSMLYAVWRKLAPIYIGEVELGDGEYLASGSEEKTTEKPENKGYAYYNDGVLTLVGFEYYGYGYNVFATVYSAITVTRDVEILIVGKNVINCDGTSGIYAKGASVAIKGDGELKIYDAETGILVQNGSLAMQAASVKITSSSDSIALTDGDFSIVGGKLEITSEIGSGIFIYEEGNVTVKDCVLNIFVEGYGISSDNGNMIINADVSINSNQGYESISVNGDILIEGGNITIKGFYWGISSYITEDDAEIGGNITINSGRINVDVYEDAIYAINSITISGSDTWITLKTSNGGAIVVTNYSGKITTDSIKLDGVKILNVADAKLELQEDVDISFVRLLDKEGKEIYQVIIASKDVEISFGESYVFNATHHWFVCTSESCPIHDGDIAHVVVEGSGYGEHTTDGVCVCGYNATLERDVYVGGVGLLDGDYLTNNGIITRDEPRGMGYAHYENGILTLSGYTYIGSGYVYYTEVYDENYSNDYSAVIYSEVGLKIVFIGENKLVNTSTNEVGKGIVLVGANLEIIANSDARLYLESSSDGIYIENGDVLVGDGEIEIDILGSGDGIDVTNGDVTVNDGKISINSGDHGIEIDNTVADGEDVSDEDPLLYKGNLYINGGEIRVNAADDGFDAELDIVIYGGNIEIYAEDNGIDSGEDTIISGGSINIKVENNDGVESSGDFVMHGGNLNIDAVEYGILVGKLLAVYDGAVSINGDCVYPLNAYGEISFGCTVEIITDHEEYYDETEGFRAYVALEEKFIIGRADEATHIDEDGNHVCDECDAIIKIVVEIGGVTANDADYSGNAASGFLGTPSADSVYTGKLEIVYVGRGDTVYPESEKAPTEAGEYTVIIRIPYGEIEYCGEKSLNFAIRELFEVSFNANGGSGSMDPSSVNGAFALPENGFTPPVCKVFTGWSTAPDGDIIEGSLNVTENTVLYAIYSDAHNDANSDHLCDGCGAKLNEHSFADGICTLCGAAENVGGNVGGDKNGEDKDGSVAIIIVAIVSSVVLIGGVAVALVYMKKRKIQ